MNILLTGAFGNIGTSTLGELISRGHHVRCFDVRTKANEKTARRWHGPQVEVVWGDLRRPEDIAAAVAGQDAVIHLAFIIPKLSITGVESESKPDLAYAVNVGGTRNLIQAMEAQPKPPKLLFTSSLHIYGRTQDCPPPRKIDDPVQPLEHYSRHKVECEQMVQASHLQWVIFRLAASMPISLKLDPGMYDVPLNNRMEFVFTRDVGFAAAAAVASDQVWGKILHIGGGPKCQYYFREIVQRIMDALKIGMLPEEAFSKVPFCTDWLDTAESQALLSYQRHDLDDYIREMMQRMGWRRYFIKPFRFGVRWALLRKSPYLPRGGRRRPVPVGAG